MSRAATRSVRGEAGPAALGRAGWWPNRLRQAQPERELGRTNTLSQPQRELAQSLNPAQPERELSGQFQNLAQPEPVEGGFHTQPHQ